MSKWIDKKDKLAFVGGKVLIFGEQGTGKSTLAGTFPKICLVDTEDGQTYYLEKNENILKVLPTISAAEVQDALNELDDENVINTFDTVVVDSGTKLYENMQAAAYNVAEKRAKKQNNAVRNSVTGKGKMVDLDDLNISRRDWGHIKRWNQQLTTMYILLSNMGKWAVITAHIKDVFDDPNSVEKKKIGTTADLAKKADYNFDIVLRTFTRKGKNGDPEYFAEVLKDRTEVTKTFQILKNPTFDIWRERWESTRKYGKGNPTDLRGDEDKSADMMSLEDNELLDLRKEFRKMFKNANKASRTKINKIVKNSDIENPLTTTELNKLREIVDLIKVIS